MTLRRMYDQIPGGARRLAAARLRESALAAMVNGLEVSGLSKTELASRLGVGKSAVNAVVNGNGNVRMTTLAEYAHELGMEVELVVRPRRDLRWTTTVPAVRSRGAAGVGGQGWIPVSKDVGARRVVAPAATRRTRFALVDRAA